MKPRPLSFPISLDVEHKAIDRSFAWESKRVTHSPGRPLLHPWTQADLHCGTWCNELASLLKMSLLFSFTVTRCLFLSPQRARFHLKIEDASSSMRVDNLLKCSLLFSLTTLVLGIIFLQWLRLHMPRPYTPVEEAYALFRERTTKLNRWNIRRGLTILPLLLQLALIFFLGALMEPLIIFGSSCSTFVPVTGMMVFAWYIWGLTKVESIIDPR